MATFTRTFRYRVKDKHRAELARMARAVNFVWNFANETQRTATQRGDRWPSYFDLSRLVVGTSKDLDLTRDTIEVTCKQYVTSRRTSRRRLLRFRGERNLGWVPMRAKRIALRPDGFFFRNRTWALWKSRDLPVGAVLLDGSSFSADARGRWYLNLVVSFERDVPMATGPAVGIDLGLKSVATLSTGEAVPAPQHFRRGAERLAKAQRAGKKRLAAARHAKIANQRRDFLHKLSTDLVRRHGAIFVGDVSSSRLARTSFAKSIHDVGWSSLRRMLQYKSDYAGIVYREVDERGSTQTCSDCGLVGGPKGRKGLVVREWTCRGCGSIHDRDVNAATNILRFAHEAPTGACA